APGPTVGRGEPRTALASSLAVASRRRSLSTATSRSPGEAGGADDRAKSLLPATPAASAITLARWGEANAHATRRGRKRSTARRVAIASASVLPASLRVSSLVAA